MFCTEKWLHSSLLMNEMANLETCESFCLQNIVDLQYVRVLIDFRLQINCETECKQCAY